MIIFPKNRKEVVDRAKADVKSQLPNSNPWLKNSFLSALITGYSGRVYEFYLQMKNALLEMFPDTADGAYLERWGSYVSITRNPATQASGYVVFTGNVGTTVHLGTTLSSSEGETYTTTADATITTNTVTLSSLTRNGSTAIANTSTNHNLATGMTVTIAGATQAGYNGSVVITVVDQDTFTYTVSNALTTPATTSTSITVSSQSIIASVQSVNYGLSTNQSSGTQLTVTSPIAGVDSTVYVAYDDIRSGTDLETDDQYRTRVLYRYQNPIALFNKSAIVSKAKETSGVTRVWVNEAGSSTNAISVSSLTRSGNIATVVTTSNHNLEPGQYVTISGAAQSGYNIKTKVIVIDGTTFAYYVPSTPTSPATGTITAAPSIPNGQVKIYFMRDNDTNPIPSSSAVNTVKNKILTIKPAHVTDGDVIVNAPTAVSTNFTFTALNPNTTAMQTAITNSLSSLFSYGTTVGTTFPNYAYTSAIWQTVDETGALVKSFTLSSPSGDVTVNEGEIPVLGTITFP